MKWMSALRNDLVLFKENTIDSLEECNVLE